MKLNYSCNISMWNFKKIHWIIHTKSRKNKNKLLFYPWYKSKKLVFWCCLHKQAILASSSGIHGYDRLPCERDEGELMNLHDRLWLLSIESIAHESAAQDPRLSSKDSSVAGKLPLNASPAVLSRRKRMKSSSHTHRYLAGAFYLASSVSNKIKLRVSLLWAI